MSYKRIALVATLSLLAACGGDSSTNPIDTAISGSVSFSFTGAGGGSFSATGGITSAALAASPYTTTWAAGFKDTTDNGTNIAANVPKSSTTSDLVVVTISGQSAGTFSIVSTCSSTDKSSCTSVSYLQSQSSSGSTFSNICTLTTGTVTITSISNTNATGSFSGNGTCFTSTGSNSAWVVTNGSFNVPLLPNVPPNLP